MPKLPDKEASLWREEYPGEPVYRRLDEDIKVDTVIIGAGITGLTAAYLLKQSGQKVAVLEKETVGGGTTGRTTGKVTAQHNLIYASLYDQSGKQTARQYADANTIALETVNSIISKEKISCGWQRDDNYVYTVDAGQVSQFRREAEAAASLDLPATFETETPLPFKTEAAVRFSNQAKLHSQQYLLGLAEKVNGDGSYIFENSNAISIKDGSPGKVKTRKASVIAGNIIVATNVPTMPLMARGGFCILEYPNESYIVAGILNKTVSGMYISPDKGHYSILPISHGGQNLLLVGGESNISGLRGSKKARYERLADYAEKHFGVTEITHKWSDRDYLSYDKVPLAGKLYPWSKHLFTATAFGKWGLTNGTAAATILHDLITATPNSYAAAFNSNRSSPIKFIPKVAAQYIFGRK